jgi:hypothetical protein
MSNVYGVWIENHIMKARIDAIANIVTAITIIASIVIFALFIWIFIAPSSSDPSLNSMRYLMVIAPAIIISIAIFAGGWYPLSVQRRAIPIRIKMSEEGIIWRSHSNEISIPWSRLDQERKGSRRDLMGNPEVYILRDIVLEGGVTRKIWWYGWDWTLWENDMLLAIRIGYRHYRANLRKAD